MLEIIDSLRSAYSVGWAVIFIQVIICVIGNGESFIPYVSQWGAVYFFGLCSA